MGGPRVHWAKLHGLRFRPVQRHFQRQRDDVHTFDASGLCTHDLVVEDLVGDVSSAVRRPALGPTVPHGTEREELYFFLRHSFFPGTSA